MCTQPLDSSKVIFDAVGHEPATTAASAPHLCRLFCLQPSRGLGAFSSATKSVESSSGTSRESSSVRSMGRPPWSPSCRPAGRACNSHPRESPWVTRARIWGLSSHPLGSLLQVGVSVRKSCPGLECGTFVSITAPGATYAGWRELRPCYLPQPIRTKPSRRPWGHGEGSKQAFCPG